MSNILKCNDALLLAELNETVQTLHHELYPDLFKPFDLKLVSETFVELLKNDRNHFYVYKKDEKHLGFVWFEEQIKPAHTFMYETKKLYIHMISVNESSRGLGIGKYLMKFVESFALKNGYDTIELDYWFENKHASYFYESLGYNVKKTIVQKKFN